MAGGSSSSREQNFWPGFVDALTNVVLVMVFTLVVFSLALFYFMTKRVKVQVDGAVKQQVQEKIGDYEQRASSLAAAHDKIVGELQVKLSAAAAENARLSKAAQAASLRPDVEGQAGQPKASTPPKAPVAISGRGELITVSFAPGITSMEQKLYDALDAAIGGYDDAASWKMSIVARSGETSPSEGRRLGFYRIALIRDHLVTKGVRAAQIDNVIQEASPSDTTSRSLVTLRIQRRP